LSEEQRRQSGCSARRMQADFHHGLLRAVMAESRPGIPGGRVHLTRL
jgi:hypothetical protein